MSGAACVGSSSLKAGWQGSPNTPAAPVPRRNRRPSCKPDPDKGSSSVSPWLIATDAVPLRPQIVVAEAIWIVRLPALVKNRVGTAVTEVMIVTGAVVDGGAAPGGDAAAAVAAVPGGEDDAVEMESSAAIDAALKHIL